MTTTQLIVFPSKSTLTVSPSSDQSTLHTTWPLIRLKDLIEHEIEALVHKATAVEKTFSAELQYAERLRQSMLKQAFTEKMLKSDVPASLTV